MTVLMSSEIKEQIVQEVTKCKDCIQLITAFCKVDGFKFIEEKLVKSVNNKRLLVRFCMDDILLGSSDLEIYDFCKEYNWKLYIRFDLHAKTYIFDDKRCIIGSANLTNKGLVLDNGGNYEIACICKVEPEDIEKINALFDDAIEMNDNLYFLMKEQLSMITFSDTRKHVWSKDIIDLFQPKINILFANDFPKYDSYKEYVGINIEFLELDSDWNIQSLKQAFKCSKIFLWLKSLLVQNNNEMYFGALTVHLHDILINDPRPYRKEVKVLLARLLRWVQDLQMDEIIIDRPNHSQRIKFVK